MSTRMLIDARHSEETRVTVVKGNRVEEFDYESSTRRQLKGNIYLARVTRVEPSLQAAFVEYGGNRHGFLAFSEIHPDYYQIPVEDREAMIAAEMADAKSRKSDEDAAEDSRPKGRRRRGRKSVAERAAEKDATISEEIPEIEAAEDAPETDEPSEKSASSSAESKENASDETSDKDVSNQETLDEDTSEETSSENDDTSEVINSDEEDKDSEIEEAADRRRAIRALKRRYSIQEVIKRRQVLLIQVVKEERGNKGAALSTYLSLAGRYCVLMPNSTHSGGISRKISNIGDRKKLKNIISSLEVPDEMGLIVRTAGLSRTKTEIKRDYDYLLRLWTGIRDLTLKSIAPTLVYEEGNLIKRTIRDLYAREVDEILVEGEQGYRAAKDFMKLLMPSHAKKVQHYKDSIPLYHRYQVESHLEAMYQPVVQLKSGGYIVINPTEALISIDVNSGRATKEQNIEETAVKTNLEAAEEVARQLRLRDMAGLVVIDFIDMEDRGNNRSVERRMKDMLKNDRARIQVGRISSFGLMEMSRQRLRPNLLEVAMETCATCAGSGIVRSVESAALMALRQLEEEGIRNRSHTVRISTNPDVAIYLLNKKRSVLSDLESQYDLIIEVLAQPTLGQSDIEITRENTVHTRAPVTADVAVTLESVASDFDDAEEAEDTQKETAPKEEASADTDEDHPRKKRRRRRRRRRGSEDNHADNRHNNDRNEASHSSENSDTSETTETSEGAEPQSSAQDDNHDSDGDEKRRPRRRRGTRGGRRRRSQTDETTKVSENRENRGATTPESASEAVSDALASTDTDTPARTADTEDKPVRRRRRVRRTPDEAAVEATAESKPADDVEKPKRRTRRKAASPETSETSETKDIAETAATTDSTENSASTVDAEEKPKPRRRRSSKTADAKVEAAPSKEEAPADTTAEKPKRKRRPTKASADKADVSADAPAKDKPAKPRRTRQKKQAPTTEKAPAAKTAAEPTSAPAPKATIVESAGESSAAGRKGWWQRTFG